ncbi:hypothetical protein C8Q75DRAFT_757573 [Abortiporus biennis]|nr:hypothetical protein C8Q75DRAFT_757573 [Abortiporus biennis]
MELDLGDRKASERKIEDYIRGLSYELGSLLRLQKDSDAKLAELREQLDIRERGFRSIRDELTDARKQWERKKKDLENEIVALKGFERRVMCLIDGDGSIFSRELLAQGQQGGHQAARHLAQEIQKYLALKDPSHASAMELSIYIFLHKKGLMDALGRSGFTMERSNLDDFLTGFNQAGQRFVMVDVGAGKENADSKLKVFLQDSIRSPQTWKVFLGVSHDNGYVPELQSLITDGLRDKLILLPGYREIVHAIKCLNFPTLVIPDLFMAEKLSPALAFNIRIPNPQTPSSEGSSTNAPSKTNGSKKAHRKGSDAVSVSSSSVNEIVNPSPNKGTNKLNASSPSFAPSGFNVDSDASSYNSFGSSSLAPSLSLQEINKPCYNFHLTKKCTYGAGCVNSHQPISEAMRKNLAKEAKKKPCPVMGKYGNCKYNESKEGCIFSHQCPHKMKCTFLPKGNCKFGGVEAHR